MSCKRTLPYKLCLVKVVDDVLVCSSELHRHWNKCEQDLQAYNKIYAIA